MDDLKARAEAADYRRIEINGVEMWQHRHGGMIRNTKQLAALLDEQEKPSLGVGVGVAANWDTADHCKDCGEYMSITSRQVDPDLCGLCRRKAEPEAAPTMVIRGPWKIVSGEVTGDKYVIGTYSEEPRACTQCGATEGYVLWPGQGDMKEASHHAENSDGTKCFDCWISPSAAGLVGGRLQQPEKLPGEDEARWSPMSPTGCSLRGRRLS